MRLKVSQEIWQEVDLSRTQVDEVTRARLKQMVFPGEYLRKDGEKTVLKQDDPHHRHGSISEVYVRDASELDIAVFKVLEAL